MLIKTTMRYHLIPVTMTMVKKTATDVDEDVKRGALIRGCISVATVEKQYGDLIKY